MPHTTSILCLLFAFISSSAVAGDVKVLPIWPGEVPGEKMLSSDFIKKVKLAEAKNTKDRVFAVTTPTIAVYPADSKLSLIHI